MKKKTPPLPFVLNDVELEFLSDVSKEVIGRSPEEPGPLSIVPVEPAGLSPAQVTAMSCLCRDIV